MTPAVAKYIGDNFTVVTQVSGLASSFDATVWRGNAGTPYAGQVYISMRGTQEVPDFLADGDLSTSGLAHEQLVDMVNWWLRETTPANQTAKQIAISTVSIPGLPRLQNFVAASSVQGTGNLLGISAIKSVDGHSLGGYLASAFVRLFGKGWPVESINTFNSAGFSRLATLNIENGFSQITQVIGAELGLSAFSGAQNNYFAENGINVTTNTWNPVGFKQYGTRTELFQEDLTPGLIDNHYMYKLTDLLALGNALAQLDQTLDLNKLSTLVSAGSNQMAASYEGVLDSIRKLLLGASVPSTQTGDANAGNAGPQPAARIEFQTNLAALQNAPAFQALASNVHIELATADLDTRAQNDFSALISLITLSPTVLTGSASLLEGVLGTAWNNEFAQWQADANLTAEQRAADQANFSDNYLADRATMLAWLVKANTEDKLTLDGSKYDSRDLKNWEFTDLTKNLTITVNGLLGFENPDPANKVIFGSDGNDGNITGGVAADALYGGAGVDTLDGGKDEDYLEGNAGADILTGGQDDDILSGGAGEDTYKFTSGDGRDTVLDSDGQGRIIIDADTLTGGQESTTGVGLWESTDKKYHYTRMSEADGSTTLTVLYGSKDRLFIKNFVDGMLGITLGVDTPVLPPPPAYTEALVDNYPSDDPIGRNYDRYYTNISMLITGTSNDDFIRTGSADDQIEGHGGHDNLVGRAGNDRIYADSRIDIAAAIEAAKESQPADPTASLLSGGSGEDLLIGRLSSNMMFGGGGSDTLIGGGDVDVIEGDGVDSDLGFGITVTKTFALDFDVDTQIYTHYCEQTLGDVITRYARLSGVASDGDGDADTIITGAGGDLVMADGGDDYLALGSGNDVGIGGAGSDIIDGGDDRDTLFGDFRWDAGPAPDGETEAQRYIRIGLDASEHGSDLIFGGAGGDYIEGNGRDDVIYGGSGSDRLLGDDLLTPGAWHGKDRIDGGAGDDTILGNGGDDILSGGADDDSVSGDDARTPGQYHGKDYLDGGDGADILWGDGNDDELIGGAGDDYLEGDYSTLEAIYHGKDFLSGGQGNDVLLGEGNDDVLHGGDDKDVLYGDALPDMALPAEANGSDILYGEAGDDELHGGGGNDLLIGGAGTDSLKGDDGDDSYRFAAGDSPTTALGENEWISDASGNNTVIFESAVADDLTLRSSNAGYYLAIDYSPGDRLLVQGGFAGAVATYEFADGERLSYTELIGRLFDGINNRTGADGQQIVTGGRDDNTLIVGSGNAILSGGRGNDTLITSGGGNTYLYNLGDGTDYIDDSSKSAGFMAANILRFGHGITAADLRLGLGSLRIQVGSDPANAIHIDGFAPDDVYAQPAIDRFEFADGSVLSYAQLLERGFDLTGDAGDNVITGTNINDRINGGAGSDTMTGGAGSDSYTWGAGSGQDVIDNTDATPDKTDTLLIDALLPSDLLLTRSGDDLLIRRRESSDQVTLLKHFTSAPIDVIAFADGSLWRGPEITAHVTNELTENADTYTGTAADDVIDGLAGNDTIRGLAGNDTISGGAGNDSLGGDNGDDLLLGDAGDDSLSGDDGNDILSGGAGTNTLQGGAGSDTLDARSAGSIDTLLGGPGSDTYLYGRGAGWDTIQETGSNPGDIDRLVMAPDIAPSDVLLARFTGGGVEYDHLQIGIKGSTNTISLHNYFTRQDDYYKIERIEFADGTVWDTATVRALLDAGTALNDTLHGDRWDSVIDGGAGSDTIYGMGGSDTLSGGSENDTLFGGIGDNILSGNTGSDRLFGGVGNDTYRFGRGDGTDTLVESFEGGGDDTLELGAGIAPENVALYRHGGDLVVVLDASPTQITVASFFTDANNQIEHIRFADGTHWSAADIAARIIAGTPNALTGTAGDDTFVVDNTLDTISEGANQGTDSVQSSVTWTLGDNLENLTLTGVLNINGTGNALPNLIIGNSSNNVLTDVGRNDTLRGGAGDDTYYTNYGTLVQENPGEGTDTLITTNGSGGQLPDAVENFTVTGASYGTTTVTGNALDNIITAREGDTVIGNGGDDTLIFRGDSGLPFYYYSSYEIDGSTAYVDSPGDRVIIANAAEGLASRVISSIDRVLDEGIGTLELAKGSAARIGTGNALNNALQGNELANTLYGLEGDDSFYGGDANDTLVGGRGNDSYYLNPLHTAFFKGNYDYPGNSGSVAPPRNDDILVEAQNEGSDTVYTPYDYTLLDNFENLVLETYTITVTGEKRHALRGTGNALDNTLTGNAGDNILDGSTGADRMIGLSGNDSYVIDNPGDVVVETAGDGTDTVYSTIAYSLGQNVENLVLTGSGPDIGTGNSANNRLDGSQSAAANALIGGAGDDIYVLGAGDVAIELAGEGSDTVISTDHVTLGDTLENLVLSGSTATTGTGNASNNILDGSQDAASNLLIGLAGDDRYVVDNVDVIIEAADGGIDTAVVMGTGYVLADNVENLIIAASAGAANGTGNALNNVLTGNNDDNRLDGGAGADLMRGGWGRDTYVVDNVGDVIEDDSGYGTVEASISYILNSSTENLVLTGSVAISGTGNASDNILDGSQNAAANLLAGGQGNDRYIVGLGDTVSEGVNEGTDWVQTELSYTLGDNLEKLHLTGTANASLSGNALDNWLFANGGDNLLNGMDGADLMGGGGGNDTYIVDNVGDVVSEELDAGTDLIESSATLTLSANVENLTLTGSAALNASGNALDNVLSGNAGANILDGGAGNDVYVFARGGGQDTISEASDASAGKKNTLRFAAGISPADVVVARTGSDLMVRIIGSTDSVTIQNFYRDGSPNNPRNPIQQIEFSDHTVWTIPDLVNLLNQAPTGDLSIVGTASANQVLYAYNTLADADGMGALGFQWQSSTDGTNWSASANNIAWRIAA